VTGIEASRAAVLGGTLSSGELVQLILGRHNHYLARIPAAVLSVRPNGSGEENWSLIVALQSRDARRYVSLFATANVVLLLNPGSKLR